MLEKGIRGLLVVGLLTASACADRGRGTERSSGRTGLSELNVGGDGAGSMTDSGTPSSDDPPIVVVGDDGSGYQAYQRWVATEQGLIGPVCDCAVSFGAYTTQSECQGAITPIREDACVTNFSRSYSEGAAIFFDCLNNTSSGFGTCLSNQTCYDQSDYQYCSDEYNTAFDGCVATLSETELGALNACSNG